MDVPAPAVTSPPWTLRRGRTCLRGESLVVVGRTDLTVGLRVLLVLCVGLKWLCAWGILRLHAGAALGLLCSRARPSSPPSVRCRATGRRVALGVTALAVMALLAASLHAFPSPELPRP